MNWIATLSVVSRMNIDASSFLRWGIKNGEHLTTTRMNIDVSSSLRWGIKNGEHLTTMMLVQ